MQLPSLTTKILFPMKAILRLIITVFTTTALLAGCNTDEKNNPARLQGMVYCGQSSSTILNPQLSDGGVIVNALSPQVFDTLVQLNPQTWRPMPRLATKWSINADRTEYIFTLREGVEFHSTTWFNPSRSFNALDVVFSFKRLVDSHHPYHLTNNGHYPWFQSIDFKNTIKDVVALNDQQVKFILTQPDNTFLSNLSTSFAVIHSAEYGQQLIKNKQKHRIDINLIGTGPYKLEASSTAEIIRLTRNNSYWQAPAKLKNIVFNLSSRGTGGLAKLLRNECDAMPTPITSQLSLIKSNPELVLDAKPAMNVAFLALDTQHFALSDSRVRQAISLAIHRQSLIDSVYYGEGNIADSMLPSSSWGYQSSQGEVRYDKIYAKNLLVEAGFSQGLNLTMWVPNLAQSYNPSPRKTAELIQSNLEEIGINLTLIHDDHLLRSQVAAQPNTDIILTGWSAYTSDPDNIFRPLLSCEARKASFNTANWCNRQFDSLLDQAKKVNHKQRLVLYHQVQTMLNKEVPVIPIAHGMQYQAHHYSLSGFKLNPFNVGSFANVIRNY